MKLTNTHHMKAKSGMTLLELTVVILVLLSLISILFVGARAWKKGSDRSANILNVRNVQQAVRGYENMNQLKLDDAVDPAKIFTVAGGEEGFLKEPTTPKGAAYDYTETVGEPGVLYIENPAQDGADYWYTAAEEDEKTSDW